MRVHGFVSKPEIQKLNRNSIFVFVNGRLIRDRLVQHAITEAYRNIIPPSVFPVVLLFLELPSGEVDVNVHPSKTEVRFRQQIGDARFCPRLDPGGPDESPPGTAVRHGNSRAPHGRACAHSGSSCSDAIEIRLRGARTPALTCRDRSGVFSASAGATADYQPDFNSARTASPSKATPRFSGARLRMPLIRSCRRHMRAARFPMQSVPPR